MGITDSAMVQYNNLPVVPPSPQRASGQIDKKLYETCQDFESIFVKQMLDSMKATIDTSNDVLNGGFAEDIYQDMLYQNYAQKISHSANLGIARLLYNQLSAKTV